MANCFGKIQRTRTYFSPATTSLLAKNPKPAEGKATLVGSKRGKNKNKKRNKKFEKKGNQEHEIKICLIVSKDPKKFETINKMLCFFFFIMHYHRQKKKGTKEKDQIWK